MTIFNSKYKKAGVALYEVIGELYIHISDEIKKIDELEEDIDNNELLSNELLFILFFFSTIQLQKYFGDKVVTKKIFDTVHNSYFAHLENKMMVSKSKQQNLRNLLNFRYSSYFKIYESENMFFELTSEFLRNIESKQTTNLNVITPLSLCLVKANELLNGGIKIIDEECKIS